MSIFVIAEAGVNHNGSMRQAEHLILAAKRAGADAVKFQLFNADSLGRPELRPLQFDIEKMADLKAYADRTGIEFLCTPFDELAVKQIFVIGVRRLKISSGCLRNTQLLKAAALTKLPIILSTGMSTLPDVQQALGDLGHEWTEYAERQVTLLHCTSAYPCPIGDVNLKAIESMRFQFGYRCNIGYSDHTQGITVPIAAAALGATVIEKHLTLDRNMDGPDHISSIEPHDFRVMVTAIRTVEEAMGDGRKVPQPSEHETRRIWGRL